MQEIAALKQKSNREINIETIKQLIRQENTESTLDLDKTIQYVLDSYFLQTSNKNKIIDFIHPSFKDYLLAEYIMEKIRHNQIEELNFQIPNNDCVDFICGWAKLFSSDQQTVEYVNKRFRYFSIRKIHGVDETVQDIIPLLRLRCYDEINENTLLSPQDDKENILVSRFRLSNKETGFIWLHRWISLLIFNILPDSRLPIQTVTDLIKTSSHMYPPYYKRLQNLDFQNIDLSGADLSGSNFNNANLKGVNLSNSDLTDAIFTDADLSSSNLSNAKIIRTSFEGSDLSNADFSGSVVSHVIFIDSIISQTNFSGAKFKITSNLSAISEKQKISRPESVADFSTSFVLHATLDNLFLEHVSFDGALLMNSDLSSSKLKNATFNDSILTNVDFYESELNKVQFHNSSIEDTTFNPSILDQTEFHHSSLSNESFASIVQDKASVVDCKQFEDIDKTMTELIKDVKAVDCVRYASLVDSSKQVRLGGHNDKFDQLLSHKDKKILIHVIYVNKLFRKKSETHMGAIHYVITRFEKLRLITFTHNDFVVVVTTEINVDYNIILEKIHKKLNIPFTKTTLNRDIVYPDIRNKEQLVSVLENTNGIKFAAIFKKDKEETEILINSTNLDFQNVIEDVKSNRIQMWRRWRSRSKFTKKIGSPKWVVMKYDNCYSISFLLDSNNILKLILEESRDIENILKSLNQFRDHYSSS